MHGTLDRCRDMADINVPVLPYSLGALIGPALIDEN